MKRSSSKQKAVDLQRPRSNSKSKSKDKKKSVPASQEEEKKQPVQLGPVIYQQNQIIAVRQRANPRLFDIGRVVQDFRQADNGVQVQFYEMNYNQNNQRARYSQFAPDQQRPQELVEEDRVAKTIELQKKEAKKLNPKRGQPDLNQPLNIKKREFKEIAKILRQNVKNVRAQEKERKKQIKEEEKNQEKEAKLAEKRKAKEALKKNNKKRKVREEVKEPVQAKRESRAERMKRRVNRKEEEWEEEEEKVEQINTMVNADGEEQERPKKKRVVKAEKKAKPVKKVKVELQPREDVEIVRVNETKESQDQELFLSCCQTCSNRNCLRAVNINSFELFEKCINSKAYVTSLIERLSPEIRICALEEAISKNCPKILDIILKQTQNEDETRMKKRDAQLSKFETGEVSNMAFGVKVAKVQMMRGNRQGNNAFLEDPKHQFKNPFDYIKDSEYFFANIYEHDTVTLETLQVLKAHLNQQQFQQFMDKSIPVVLRKGCYNTLLAMFQLYDQKEQPEQGFFNDVFFQLLTAKDKKDIKLNKVDIDRTQNNPKCRPAFVAALNPTGCALPFLKELGLNVDTQFQKQCTAHFAAVCQTSKNIEFLIENEIDLHFLDEHKKSPLIYAFEARANYETIRLMLDDLTKSEKDVKDDHKKMAVHFACQKGVKDLRILDLLVEHKAKFSMAGGWDKYTPLIYACTYGQFAVVEYLINNVPRINLDKGDKFKRTPLIMAVRNGHQDIASLLIKHNADIDLGDSSGNTPLHYAAAYGWIECVRLLLANGAEASPENLWKSTPLTIAMQKNHLLIVQEFLKSQELNVNSKDEDGRTILSLSMFNINAESIKFIELLLQKFQADPNSQDAKGKTPLFHLVENMINRKKGLFDQFDQLEYKLVGLLLEAGASVNMKTKEGKTPFTLAFEGGNPDLLKMFGGNVDLNQDPTLLFVFKGTSVLKTRTQDLIVECMNMKPLDDEVINYVNDQGFTPFLYYLNEALPLQQNILNVIHDQINKQVKKINNQTILEQVEKNLNHNQFGVQITPQIKQIMNDEIITPFIKFLQILLDKGANPNAYVLKLKQWREEVQPVQSSQATSVSQLTVAQQAAAGRRPPEKQQYISEDLGLCNAIHLMLRQKTASKLFDFIMNIQGIELNQSNLQNMTPFFMLVKTKDIKNNKFYKGCFEKLLGSGKVDINAPDQFGCSAFWHFYINKRIEEAFYLVDKGANINHIDNYGTFALKRELFDNNYEMMKKLLQKGADPDQGDEFNRTVLHLACNLSHRRDMTQVIQLLIQNKCDLNALDFKKRTPLHYVFVAKNKRFEQGQYDPINVLKLLINDKNKNQINLAHQDCNGKTLLHLAAQRGSIECFKFLDQTFELSQELLSIEDKFLNTPLCVAINFRRYEFIQEMIKQGQVKLKGFIYQEPKPKQQVVQQNNFIFGQNNVMDDEQSDLEYAEVQEDLEKKKHDKDQAITIFRYIIKNQLANFEKLFIQSGYDKIQMVIDYICEGEIAKLFEVIEKHFKDHEGAKGSILIQKNEKQQNLVHILSRNSHRIKNINDIVNFYKQLAEEGVNPYESDIKGRTALHFAVKSGNIHYVKYLIHELGFDVNAVDDKQANMINTLLMGDRILRADAGLLEYLLKQGGNVNQLYEESLYQDKQEEQKETYKTTSVIHAIRHESKQRDNIKKILSLLLKYADMSQQDSEGREPFMYVAMRNHFNTFNFILDTLEEKKTLQAIKRDQVDKLGKSVIHYIVQPLGFGSFENYKMLTQALKAGFKHDIKDKKGLTPFDYACQQKSGQMKEVFIEMNLYQKQDEEMKLENLLEEVKADNVQFDFESDAQNFLKEVQMQIDPHKFVPCDPAGKFNEDCVVMFDDHTDQHFDVYLTRVEIGKFQPGGDYLFYRMQLVLDQSRDLAILLTRWGRIGEEGAFQKTPFSTHEDAVQEFKKIFEQKTNNKWCPQDKFKKSWRKFQLMRSNYVTIDQKNFLQPFNYENAQISNLAPSVLDVLKEVCDVDTYLKALQNSGVDPKAMPFSNLNRKNLYEALEVLEKLQKILTKLEGMNPRPYAEKERNQLLGLREKMWYHSSRFYEFIPHEEFRNKMVPPISTLELVTKKMQMIQNLIEIEMASKILLAAYYRAETIHPLEYCMKAAGIQIGKIEKDSEEFKLLNEYIMNSNNERKQLRVKNIFTLNKEIENKKYRQELDNKVLLFHGSRISNFLGIMAQGLRVQPEGVRRHGSVLGRGIYFADSISKSLMYTNDQNAPQHSSKFVLICEVALGNMQEQTRIQNDLKLQEQFNSIKAIGRRAAEPNKYVILPDGAKLPIGKLEAQPKGLNSDFELNEYVIPEPNQTRMRYLIQFK